MRRKLFVEVKIRINSVLTAIGNPLLNNELKKVNKLRIINDDIQYQDGIFENLEINSNIDYIIIDQNLPGELCIEELIEKIENYNLEIRIILIIEKYDEKFEKILIKQGVYRIIHGNNVQAMDIIKLINEDEKLKKYNEEIQKEIESLKKYIGNERDSINKVNNVSNLENNNKENNKKNIKNNKIKQRNESNLIITQIKNIFSKNLKILLQKIMENGYKEYNKVANNNGYNISKNKKIIEKKYYKKNKDIISGNNYYKKNQIISIIGNNGVGKSVFSIMLAMTLKKYYKKILLIDFDEFNNSLHILLGVKKYPEKIKKIVFDRKNNKGKIRVDDLIVSFNKKIDLISSIDLLYSSHNTFCVEDFDRIINELSQKYDVIIFDTCSEIPEENIKTIINKSEKSIFLTEANISEISKSKRLLELYNYKGIENNIHIIFNKYTRKSIDISKLKKIYMDYKVVGYIKLETDYSKVISKGIKNVNINSILM